MLLGPFLWRSVPEHTVPWQEIVRVNRPLLRRVGVLIFLKHSLTLNNKSIMKVLSVSF